MKILKNYILGEYFPPLLFGIAIFTFIFLAQKMVQVVSLVLNRGVEITLVLKLLGYSLPPILLLTIPMGVLLASLLAISKLASDNEITAMKAGGINLISIFIPLILMAFLISFVLLFSYDRILPFCNHKFAQQIHLISHKRPVLALQENTFNDLGEFRIYVYRINQKSFRLEDLIISENKPESSRFITAQEGIIFLHKGGTKLTLKLLNGAIHQIDESDRNKFQALHFNTHNITIDLPGISSPERKKGLEEMTNSEIMKEIETYRKAGINCSPLFIELSRRLSLPFASLPFTLLGITFGMRARHRSKSISFGISVAVIFSYYLLMVGAETMGIREILSPIFVMWIPNIVFAGPGVALLIKSVK